MDEDGYVLVTGGAGYVGSHVLVELINAGFKTISLDCREDAVTGYPSNYGDFLCYDKICSKTSTAELPYEGKESINRIQEITGHKPEGHAVDLMDKKAIEAVFKKYRVQFVLHLAGLKAVRESHSCPLKYYSVNVVGTINLLEVMAENAVYNIIFSSSSKVYGVPQYLPLDENHPTGQCTNPYGKTKYMVEQILQDLSKADKKWNVIILRYFNPCGAHESGKLGETRSGPPKNLMPCVCYAAMGKLKKLTIFGQDYNTPDGTAIKDYTHVVDLSRGHIAAIRSPLNGQNFRVYNLGTGQTYSILDMVKTFEKISGKKIEVEMSERKPGEIGECSADSGKANRELKWKAEKSLEQMCMDMWRWVTNDH